jgi:hypothetical protein
MPTKSWIVSEPTRACSVRKASAALALYNAGSPILALILAGLTLAHYLVSYDRIAWLLQQKGTDNERGCTTPDTA